jgi:ribosomal protein S18 acetylase RimI-like enzyme
MDGIEIKKVTLMELEDLLRISRRTFMDTFSADNSEENLRKYIDDNINRDKLAMELKNQNSEFYFSVFQDKPIGYLKLNHGLAQTELKDSTTLEIERIYVLKEFHGKKVGQLLVDLACQIAKGAEYEYVWLGVWEKNLKAIYFYKKNGFVEFDKHIFRLGEDEQTDIMMKMDLLD